jgi:hypothetical protein
MTNLLTVHTTTQWSHTTPKIDQENMLDYAFSLKATLMVRNNRRVV